jgi:hypothetical protein
VLARRATARLLSKMGGHFRNAMAAAFSMSPGEAGASSYEEVMKMYKIEINNYGNTVLQVPPPPCHAMPCHAYSGSHPRAPLPPLQWHSTAHCNAHALHLQVKGSAIGAILNKEGADLFNWPLHSIPPPAPHTSD